MKAFSLVLLLGSLFFAAANKASLKLNDNVYTEVLVAIHSDVKEDPRVIDGIKSIFTSGSRRLFNATNQRAFFQKIAILVPPSWKLKDEYEAAKKERYDVASVIVAPENKQFGDAPYVKALGGCGDEGEFIHLTPKFVADEETQERYGDPGKVLVHEWGHYRWGLQEEYPTNEDPNFYFSTATKKFEAVRCSLSMAGRILEVTGKNKYRLCKLRNGLPDSPACNFFPGFKIKNPARVSIMDRQGTSNVESFCVNGTDVYHLHNAEAPNRMNRLCRGKSAWEVMLQHPNFAGDANPKHPEKVVKTQFRIVHPSKDGTSSDKCRLSLVLDVSGSMNDDHKLQKMNKGLQKFIQYTLAVGTEIGLTTFSGAAQIKCNMKAITNRQSRLDIEKCLPTTATGGTSIGSGLKTGVTNLGSNTRGSRIILLTDGAQNTDPGPTDPSVVRVLDDAHIFVDTISFTAAADKSMVDLAKKYGGHYYYDSGSVHSNALNEAFSKSPCHDSENEEDNSIPLVSSAGELRGDPISGFVNIDSSIGNETRFVFDYDYKGQGLGEAGITVVLSAPGGKKTYSEGSKEYSVHTLLDSITITIPGVAKLGKWEYLITKNTTQPKQTYRISIMSKTRTSTTQPLILHASVKATSIAYPSPMVVLAEVTKGGRPVLGLDVVAMVDRPDKKADKQLFELQLKDNGVGADVKANDGIYSRFFTAFTEIGRYSFSLRASNPNNTAAVRFFKNAGSWGGAPNFDESNLVPIVKPEFEDQAIDEDISRAATAGASELQTDGIETKDQVNKKLQDEVDEIPPSEINDLRVLETSWERGQVTLAWTAPGNNLDEGRVSFYTVNVKGDGSTNQNTRLNGTKTAGESQKVTVDVQTPKSLNGSYTIWVTSHDDRQASQPSNKVTAGLGYVADIKDGKLPYAGVDPGPGPDPGPGSVTGIIVGVVVGMLVVVVVVVGVLVHSKKMRKNKISGHDKEALDEVEL